MLNLLQVDLEFLTPKFLLATFTVTTVLTMR